MGPKTYSTIFVLPPDHRPATTQTFKVRSSTGKTEVRVLPTGEVQAREPRPEWLDLKGISFDSAKN